MLERLMLYMVQNLPEHLRTLMMSDVLIFGQNLPNLNKVATTPSSCPRLWLGCYCNLYNNQQLFYLGFSKIYLLGVDFNFDLSSQESDENGVLIGQGESNHFHKDYRPNGEKWNDPKMQITEAHYRMLEK